MQIQRNSPDRASYPSGRRDLRKKKENSSHGNIEPRHPGFSGPKIGKEIFEDVIDIDIDIP